MKKIWIIAVIIISQVASCQNDKPAPKPAMTYADSVDLSRFNGTTFFVDTAFDWGFVNKWAKKAAKTTKPRKHKVVLDQSESLLAGDLLSGGTMTIDTASYLSAIRANDVRLLHDTSLYDTTLKRVMLLVSDTAQVETGFSLGAYDTATKQLVARPFRYVRQNVWQMEGYERAYYDGDFHIEYLDKNKVRLPPTYIIWNAFYY